MVVDAIADHHAYWWESDRLAALPWLKAYTAPPFPQAVAGNFVHRLAGGSRPVRRRAVPPVARVRRTVARRWCRGNGQLAAAAVTFLHGDLRLDQLFFAVTADDPPVTALDWQISSLGRGAYDLAYFLSQSLTTETRRRAWKPT